MDISFTFPETLTEVFFDYDYKILYGGRSSAKSSTIARALVKKSTEIHDKVIACCRENKVSLRLSTYADIKNVIMQHNLEHLFNIKRENISSQLYYRFALLVLYCYFTAASNTSGCCNPAATAAQRQ